MTQQPVVVAAGQFCAGTNPRDNLRTGIAAIEDAARRGAALLLLPEASLCPPPGIFDPAREAQPLEGWFITGFREAAAKANVAVVVGTFTPGPEGRPYNTVAAIGPDGTILGSYDKIHLYDAFLTRESAEVEAGPRATGADGLLSFELDGITYGVATCYDLRFPEIFRALADRGVTTFLVPAAWLPGAEKLAHWTHLLKSRAIENSAFVVAAGQCAPTGVGRSQILDPMGRDVAHARDRPVVITGTLDATLVAETRRVNPSVYNRRFSIQFRGAGEPPRSES